MAKIPVTDCPAGPALDAAVAKVLGWTELPAGAASPAWETPEGRIRTWEPTSFGKWRPSEDIRAAWELVENLVLKSEYEFYLTVYRTLLSVGWCANYRESSRSDWTSVDANTAPLAITRAFLLAHGVTEVEVTDE